MIVVWWVGLISLWVVALVNLMLTLRVIRWLRALEEERESEDEAENRPQLTIGAPAPDFRARTLYGESVTLGDYTGRPVAFVFVSPGCGPCRQEMPMLVELGGYAKRRAGVELVLVSDEGTAETHSWIEAMRAEDGVTVDLPVLVAPRSLSEFLLDYNPRGITPYFCHIDEGGSVRARDPLGRGEWPALRRKWEGYSAGPYRSKPSNRYR